LISKDTPEGIHLNYILIVIYFYIADYLLQTAILLQMFLWLDIAIMIKYQKPQRFENTETMKQSFNRLERKRLLPLLGLIGASSLGINAAIATFQVEQCNNMTQRYIDIVNLSVLISLEVLVAIFFVWTIRNNRRITWVKTRCEVYSIIAGVLFSFIFKIIIKATHKARSEKFGKDAAVEYHVGSFVQFVFSEFLLIAAWTWFKTQDDYFSVYNNVAVQKFSIF